MSKGSPSAALKRRLRKGVALLCRPTLLLRRKRQYRTRSRRIFLNGFNPFALRWPARSTGGTPSDAERAADDLPMFGEVNERAPDYAPAAWIQRDPGPSAGSMSRGRMKLASVATPLCASTQRSIAKSIVARLAVGNLTSS